MTYISKLFDHMDAWRHLPSYQLERRADLFFALYLPQVLEAKLGFAVKPELVPEFPIRIGAILPASSSNQSFKIDYLALSADATKAVFVELKTDSASRRSRQDDYLLAAQKSGMAVLLQGLLDIWPATSSKRKYYCLFEHLAKLGLLEIPADLAEIMARPRLLGAKAASRNIQVTSQARECIIVYVQPHSGGPNTISFREFRDIVLLHDDPISQRFAQSLSEWARIQPGGKRLKT